MTQVTTPGMQPKRTVVPGGHGGCERFRWAGRAESWGPWSWRHRQAARPTLPPGHSIPPGSSSPHIILMTALRVREDTQRGEAPVGGHTAGDCGVPPAPPVRTPLRPLAPPPARPLRPRIPPRRVRQASPRAASPPAPHALLPREVPPDTSWQHLPQVSSACLGL